MTASDAARLAAQQSKRGKVTMPLGQDAVLNNEQQTMLSKLAKNVRPKSSGPQMAGPTPAAPQGYPQGYGQSYQQPQPQVNYRPSGQTYVSREPNRRRR